MKEHPANERITEAALGLKRDREILEHIETCVECRPLYDGLNKILAASANSDLSPSEGLEHRILSSAANIREEADSEQGRGILRGMFRPALAAAASVAVIAVASFFVYTSFYAEDEVQLTVNNIFGTVNIDGSEKNAGILKQGGYVKLLSESSAEIEYERMFFINLSADTELINVKSVYSKKEKAHIFNFKLDKGQIFAKFSKSYRDIKYSFVTPHARIDSIGTEFFLEASPSGTSLLVIDGSVFVTSLSTGESIRAEKMRNYFVKDGIEATVVDEPASAEDVPASNIMQKKPEQISDNSAPVAEQKEKEQGQALVADSKGESGDASLKKREDRRELRESRKEMTKELREQRSDMRQNRQRTGK